MYCERFSFSKFQEVSLHHCHFPRKNLRCTDFPIFSFPPTQAVMKKVPIPPKKLRFGTRQSSRVRNFIVPSVLGHKNLFLWANLNWQKPFRMKGFFWQVVFRREGKFKGQFLLLHILHRPRCFVTCHKEREPPLLQTGISIYIQNAPPSDPRFW